MKETAEGVEGRRCNEETVETRSYRSNIILHRRKTTLALYERYSQNVFAEVVRFILFLPLLFPVEVSVNVVGQRRGSTFFFLSLSPFSTSALTACPCRFIFVAKRNTKFAGVWPRGTLVQALAVALEMWRWASNRSTGHISRVSERNIKLLEILENNY